MSPRQPPRDPLPARPGRRTRRDLLRGVVLMSAGAALAVACNRSAPAGSPANPTEAPKPVVPVQLPAIIAGSPGASPSASPAAKPMARFGPGPGAPGSRQPGTPKPGGTLVVGRTAEPAGLDPQLTSTLARQRITMLTYNNLIRLSHDVAIQPDLAEAWRVSPDGKQIDFTLRKGVMWHPPVSRELTAEDVKYSYERLLRESPGRGELSALDGIEVLDKYNVRFVLSAANAGILAVMADSRWGAIVNPETVQKHGDLQSVAVGTGPFVLESREVGQETRLRRNPSYFEKGKPYIERLVLKTLPDEASIVDSLRNGTLQHAALEEGRNCELLKGQPDLQIHRSPRLGYDFFSFNQAVAPFDKVEVIQAINYAVDRDECIKAAASGYAVHTAPCTPPMKQWLLPDDQWKPYYRVDLERARALLARAGYPNGFEATALTIASVPTTFTDARVVQANLKRIGITLKVESLEYGTWLRRWQRKEFEATLNTTSGFADPDTAFYRAFHSKGQNWNSIENPELDRLLDEGRAVFEVEKRKPIYDKAQRHLLEKPGHLFLFAPEMIDVTHVTVQGFGQHPTTTLWSYQNVWLDG
jgi:peptide/nickel transport system substrate-binding protein